LKKNKVNSAIYTFAFFMLIGSAFGQKQRDNMDIINQLNNRLNTLQKESVNKFGTDSVVLSNNSLIREIQLLQSQLSEQNQKIAYLESKINRLEESIKNVTKTPSKNNKKESSPKTYAPKPIPNAIEANIQPNMYYVIIFSFQDPENAFNYVKENPEIRATVAKSTIRGTWYHIVLPPYNYNSQASSASNSFRTTNYPNCWSVSGNYFER
jgi:uncharacterized membrane-anchored protein YhcB (DUF1043 family)